LQNIDGKSYPAYHGLEHEWHHQSIEQGTKTTFRLRVGRAQSDPYAPPTRSQIRIPAEQFVSQWPNVIMEQQQQQQQQQSNKVARVAAADYLLRHLYQTCQSLGADQSIRSGGGGGGGWSGPKGGDLQILAPTQHVVEQSAVQIGQDRDGSNEVILQMTINLPARGRTVLGKAAEKIFCSILPQFVASLTALPVDPLWQHVQSVQDQVWLQDQLEAERLVAFIPNGAILPRRSGVDDRPMLDAVPFTTPSSLQRSFVLPSNGKTVTGMGIPEGVTLICGGGFHGKSTLLHALQWGIYPKIPGDGREFCMVRPRATTIRAEDGRSVQSSDISDFLKDLPGKSKDTTIFSTENASGSTSQASNIVEVRFCLI
jgi:predicted ABC-class ATPase